MDATVRQRTLRALALMTIGLGTTLLVSLDPARAIRAPAFWVMFAGMCGWTIAENLVLRQDEPKSYHGKLGTRLLQAGVIATILLAAAEFFHLPGVLPRTTPVVLAGLLVLLAGATLRIVAILTLAQHFRYELRVEQGQGVMQRGIYAVLRHPSYLGIILIPLGAALILSSLLGVVVGGALMVAITIARIRAEEAVLRDAFGEEYTLYSGRTWRLVPYVY